MKKFFYVVATIFATGFISCSENSNENFKGGDENVIERVPILFTAGSGRVDISTRGTGAVGAGSTSFWRGEELNVYMFKKGTLDIAKDQDNMDIFNNEVVIAPVISEATNSGVVSYSGEKYYPTSGSYDFFAYHADDAIIDAAPELNDDETQYTVPVTINGTQDLMIAKATLTSNDTLKLQQNIEEENYELSYARAYSAYSARKDVQPNFLFQHLLSRLVFKIKPNSKKDLEVSIEEVRIKNVNTSADFIVAWDGETPESFLLNERDVNDIVLMQKDSTMEEVHSLLPLEAQKPRWNEELDQPYIDQLGESILLMPGTEYELVIFMEENGIKNFYETKIKTPDGGDFKAGYEYHVTFVVYGLEKIELNVTLEPWKEGGDIPVDSDALTNENENNENDEVEDDEIEDDEVEDDENITI